MKRTYTALLEKGEKNWSGYFPDVPGCVSVGDTRDELIANLHEALDLHISGMQEDGESLPAPDTEAIGIEVEFRDSASLRG